MIKPNSYTTEREWKHLRYKLPIEGAVGHKFNEQTSESIVTGAIYKLH